MLRRYNETVPNDQRIPLGGKGVTIASLENKIKELGLKGATKHSPKKSAGKQKQSPKKSGEKDKTQPVLFYGHFVKNGPYYPFSNWARSEFVAEGHTFTSNEQYLMWRKANLFGDKEMAKKLLNEGLSLTVSDTEWNKSLRTIKADGRKVKNFNEEVWKQNREQIMFDGLLLKFQQNEEMRELLLSTGERRLGESVVRDKIWGNGMGKNNPEALNPDNWKGLNLLGKALEAVRKQLQQ